MTDNNLDSFNQCVGMAFAKLYKSFPIPINLNISDFVDTPFEDGVRSHKAEICINTFLWLKSAGYIEGKYNYQEYLAEAYLTAKGLETLKAMPASLTESLGDQLVEVAKEGGKEAYKSLVSMALAEGMRFVAGAL